jgi:GT2 family glycosyltransferase
VGLFDTSFPFALGGDDTDLGIRVTDAGYLLATNRFAVVNHEKRTWSSVSLISKRLFRWGRMHFFMMMKHPHRTNINPPTVLSTFIILLLIFLPLGIFLNGQLIWTIFPLLWLLLEITIESLILSRKSEKQPVVEFLCTFGAKVLGIVFQTGTIIEGIKHTNLTPIL